MKAVILVGTGTPIPRFAAPPPPAAFLPLLNKPLIRHQLRALAASKIDEVTLFPACTPLRDYFGGRSSDGVRLSFPERFRDLAHGGLDASEPLLVLAGDVLPGLDDLHGLIDRHRQGNARIVAGTRGGPLSHAGIWIFSPGAVYDMNHLLALVIGAAGGTVPAVGFPLHDGTLQVATADGYLAATRQLLDKLHGARDLFRVTDDVWSEGPVFIDADATLVGPVLLGRNCSIAAGATVAGPAVLGDASMVCRNATVENSVVWAGAAAGANARVVDSIITECFTVGPGAVFEHAIALDRQRPMPVAPGSHTVQHSPRGIEAWAS